MKYQIIVSISIFIFLTSGALAQSVKDVRPIVELDNQGEVTILGGQGPIAITPKDGHLTFNRLEINDSVFIVPPPPDVPIVIECDELYMGRGGVIETSAFLAIRAKRLSGLARFDTRKDGLVFFDKETEKMKVTILDDNPTGKDGADVSILIEKYEDGAGAKIYVNGRRGREGLAGSSGGEGEAGGAGGKGGDGGYPRGAGGLGGKPANGGDGGNGADGLDGRFGGQGGTVTFNVLPGQKAPQTLYCSIEGGLGGLGGKGGSGGKGGKGGQFGDAGNAGSLRQVARKRMSRARLAPSGRDGLSGERGEPGLQGPRGAVKQVVRVIKGSKITASVSQ